MPNLRSSTVVPVTMMEYGKSPIAMALNPMPNHPADGPLIVNSTSPFSVSKDNDNATPMVLLVEPLYVESTILLLLLAPHATVLVASSLNVTILS